MKAILRSGFLALAGFVVALLVGWGLLFFTTSGVLVASEGPLRQDNDGLDSLRCTYFHGTGVTTISYWYSENGILGKAICPRLVSLQ